MRGNIARISRTYRMYLSLLGIVAIALSIEILTEKDFISRSWLERRVHPSNLNPLINCAVCASGQLSLLYLHFDTHNYLVVPVYMLVWSIVFLLGHREIAFTYLKVVTVLLMGLMFYNHQWTGVFFVFEAIMLTYIINLLLSIAQEEP